MGKFSSFRAECLLAMAHLKPEPVPIPVIPTWARFLMPVAVLSLAAASLGSLAIAAVGVAGGNLGSLAMTFPAAIFIYIGWRGVSVVGSLRFRACLSGKNLHYRRTRTAPVEVVPLDRLEVSRNEMMQLVTVHLAKPRRHLYTVDTAFSFGTRLANRIVELQEAGKGNGPSAGTTSACMAEGDRSR